MQYSAEPGQWDTSRAPYQRAPQDALTDPKVHKLTFMFASQTGKTEIEMNILGYAISHDPGPILWVWPTDELAENFSRERLAPTIADTPVLKELVHDVKSRDSKNTITNKSFPGGYIALVGANAPRKLASRPVRYLFMDEIDGFPASSGTEGDPRKLAEKRTTTFWNRKIIQVSTPTQRGLSAIEREYRRGTMERWQWKCPHCGQWQTENWDLIDWSGPEPLMPCLSCRNSFAEQEWKRQQGRWHAEHPERVEHRSFHASALLSPWVGWRELHDEYLEAKNEGGVEEMKVFTNTRLGRSWDEGSGFIEPTELEKRRDAYEENALPSGVLLLTAGVDIQDDRIECEVVGWGVGYESWGVRYAVFQGSPEKDSQVWAQLDQFLSGFWERADGVRLSVLCACVDSGGHCTSQVYRYTRMREARRIYAVKGRGGQGIPMIGKPTRNNREKAALFSLGVDAIKSVLFARLRVNKEGPDCCHWPRSDASGYDRTYFTGLVSEERVVKNSRTGKKIEWVKLGPKVRNEPLDCRVYATAALLILNPDLERLKTLINQTPGAQNIPKARKKNRILSRGVTI